MKLSKLPPITALLFVGIFATCASSQVQEPVDATVNVASSSTDTSPITVRFAFDRAAWRDVFTWLAREANLSLHLTELPSGTFTYTDSNEYSPEAAIDRINMFLLPDGFALIRSGELLSVLNLRDSRSVQRLDAIATLVTPEQIDSLGEHQVAKCLFPLEKARPVEAVSELNRLQLMVEPTALDASNQVMVIEIGRKLRSVYQTLLALEKSESSKSMLVQQVTLEHVTLEQVMKVARPHMGIEQGMMHNAEFNVSADDTEKRLFISGTATAIELFRNLVKVVDVPNAVQQESSIPKSLRSHRTRDDNLSTVYEVLQTVLLGKDVRLSMEPSTNSIVALGDATTHEIIESTIAELEGMDSVFKVIPLYSVDPYFAIALLDEMFGSKALPPNSANKNTNALRIDADPAGMKLFVRGPKDKVEQVQRVIEELDTPATVDGDRVVPLLGANAESILSQATSTWHGNNSVVLPKSANGIETKITERVIHAGPALNEDEAVPELRKHEQINSKFPTAPPTTNEALISARNEPKKPSEIEAMITDRGIVLRSSDKEALQDFEAHLRSLATSDSGPKVESVVYYLKYSTADEATQFLADLLDGVTSVADSTSVAKLVNSIVPSPKNVNLFGSYLRSGNDSPTLVTSGTLTVVADSRLNRLICVGTSTDLRLVEQYLKVIDKDQGLTTIETRGVSHVIELKHAKAEEIAKVIRDTFGDRVELNSDQKQAQQNQRSADKEKGNAASENNIQSSRNREPQMSVAVHEVSNSIVVTAPDSLFQNVKQLVEKLDQQSEQAVEVIYYPSPEGVELLRETLMQKDSRRGRDDRRSR